MVQLREGAAQRGCHRGLREGRSAPRLARCTRLPASSRCRRAQRADVFGLQRIWGTLIPSCFDEQKDDPLLFPSKANDEILSEMPPTIVWSAEFDMFLTETLRMANRLRACGRLLELVILPGIKHANNFNPALKCYRLGMDAYKLAIREYLLK